MPFSLRLDPDTEAKIRRLAVSSGRSKSQVVREAVARYAADPHDAAGTGESGLCHSIATSRSPGFRAASGSPCCRGAAPVRSQSE
jgi:hypothetical protein